MTGLLVAILIVLVLSLLAQLQTNTAIKALLQLAAITSTTNTPRRR